MSAYNIFRWYRSGWSRYSTADPVGLEADTNLYRYALDNPIGLTDPLGLDVRLCCRPVKGLEGLGVRHCYIESNTNNRRETWGFHNIETRGKWNYGEPRKNYPTDSGGECTSWRPSQTCDDGKCFTEQANKWPSERYGYWGANLGLLFAGRNSNTFARCVWEKCQPPYYSDDWERVVGNAGQNAPGWLQRCPQ